ncbi:hypothetical protein HPB50_029252 [Hyalomma asiaticum]|nr:hypothetical protein HPB50_029252 [Hyalomma asiaticum]
MPPPKEHFFHVRTPPGTSVDEVIDALEALVGTTEIYSVQNLGGQDFQVGLNSLRAVQVLLDCGGLRLGTNVSQLILVSRQVASVTCFTEVVNRLKSYGTTLRIEEACYKDRPTIRTGTRHIKMDMRPDNPLPNFARAIGLPLNTAACGVFGLRTDTCTAACPRCGGAHATVDCTARQSYSMAEAREVDEFSVLRRMAATEHPQKRLTTLRRAKRPMPREAGHEREAGSIPAKASAQAAAMRCSDERGHASPDGRAQATASETDASCSEGEEHELGHVSVSGGERDGDAASAASWATVDETAAEERCLERGRHDRTGDSTTVTKGPQSGNTPGSEEKPTQENEEEPGELVIDEHTPTPPDSPPQTTPTPTGVGRGRLSRNRDTDKVRSGNRTETLGPSGASTDKRPQRTTKVARRDFPGRLRGRTPSSGREEATAADDLDTDSDFY